jgi:DNA-3-methyladenine glycosylase
MPKMLAQSFFNRPTLLVARELLGKYIVKNPSSHKVPKGELMITEVEVYDGPHDLASHARHGRTPRASIMFGEAGRFYMFFTYGIHWMANVVTGPKDYPAAILLRAGRTDDGQFIIGPGRFTKFLGLDGKFNGAVARRASGLWFEDRGIKIPPSKIIATKRIGVDYAGPIWAEKKYNFKIKSGI